MAESQLHIGLNFVAVVSFPILTGLCYSNVSQEHLKHATSRVVCSLQGYSYREVNERDP